MRYIYSSLYYLRGITLSSTSEEILNSTQGHAVLVSDPSSLCVHLDHSISLPLLLLTAKLGKDDPNVSAHVKQQIEQLRAERKRKLQGGVFLFFEVIGEGDSFTPDVTHDYGSFVLGLDGVPKEKVSDIHKQSVRKILTAVMLAHPEIRDMEEVGSSTVFSMADGRPLYGFNFKMGSVGAFISKHPSIDNLAVMRQLTSTIISDPSLDRIVRLLNESLEVGRERFEKFLSAWMALEVFVSKNFSSYQKRFWDNLSAGVSAPIKERYLKRIHDVMQDKYRLLDKFVIISSELAPLTTDADIVVFQRSKDIRDGFSHGDSIDEKTVPVEEIQELIKKLLLLHVSR